jgi:hypothetical protein
MTLISPSRRSCDCPCAIHHGHPRPAYCSDSCGCELTCSTQPVTLLVQEWHCALFLHPDTGHLWFVMVGEDGSWDWESANEIDGRADIFDISKNIERSLRRIESVIANRS